MTLEHLTENIKKWLISIWQDLKEQRINLSEILNYLFKRVIQGKIISKGYNTLLLFGNNMSGVHNLATQVDKRALVTKDFSYLHKQDVFGTSNDHTFVLQ